MFLDKCYSTYITVQCTYSKATNTVLVVDAYLCFVVETPLCCNDCCLLPLSQYNYPNNFGAVGSSSQRGVAGVHSGGAVGAPLEVFPAERVEPGCTLRGVGLCVELRALYLQGGGVVRYVQLYSTTSQQYDTCLLPNN